MKKLFYLVALGIFVFNGLNAQESSTVKTIGNFGLYFGKLNAEFMGANVSFNGTGVYAGLGIDYAANGKFHIIPSINVLAFNPSVSGTTVNLSQIQIPIYFKALLNENFGLFLGPNIGFFAKKEEGKSTSNIGLDAGISIEASEKLSIKALYNHGLTNLNDDPNFQELKMSVSGFGLGLTYAF